MQKRKVRTLFISDLHLASPNSQAKRLSEFLNMIDADYVFLLGDIVDLWKLSSRKGRWYQSHEKVLHQLIDLANTDTKVIYVPGNHDPFFRTFGGLNLGQIDVHEEYVHTMANGNKFLLIHGDRFDKELYVGDIWHHIGEALYETIVTTNRLLNRVRTWMGKPYWSLSVALKMNSKKARDYIERFEQLAVKYAKEQNAQGVICGHIHQSKLIERDGIIYGNDGDWVESCTALVENEDGSLELLTSQAVTVEKKQPINARPAAVKA
ncbi:UDP-2,3-diacylglucosamine diphosphatase [Reinekea thalattae]|uniref:UDP-2,3-diacylglucosamine diphosphatase n=1 Tax=Reinekea thalattae TaxID=2593301 RepID=A0A5C8Z7K4_9GAMM|nr:UDP-2,3-diacylglucosamine diphosphatase [Reinekea thalattae]TXR53299.1 UDP-2,3-diacylglucosamine diphosphatase [Reinekea thalattae]